MSSHPPLRVAVLGAGRLGGFHAQKLAHNPSVQLVAVVDPVEAARNRLATECGTDALADHRPLLDRLDAAVIAAPTRLHHELGLELIDRGIHVLVEKPLCATVRQADQLVLAARRRRVVLQVGHVERFNPALAAAAPAIENPRYLEAVRAGSFTFRSMDIGVVLDLMIHDIDLVLSLVRSPLRKVEAIGFSVLGGHEDVAQARLEFRSGCVANLTASRVSCEAVRRMHVWCPTAHVSMDFATRKTTLVRPSETLRCGDLDLEALAAEPPDRREYVLGEHLRREDVQPGPVDALALEHDDFLESIRSARSPRVPGDQGRDAVAVAETILAKIRARPRDDALDGLPPAHVPVAGATGPWPAPAPSRAAS